MAATVDNTGQSASGLSATSITIASFAVGAGANRCIYLGVSQWKAADTAPTAVFNGSENFVVHDQNTIADGGGTRRVTILKLLNPSNVTANIVVSWASAVDEAVCGATSWFGVDQTSPFGAAVKNSGTGTTSSVIIPNASGDVVHDVLSCSAAGSGVPVGTPNQTARWQRAVSASSTEGNGQSATGAGSNITCTWSTFTSNPFVHIGVAVVAAVAAGANVTPASGSLLVTGLAPEAGVSNPEPPGVPTTNIYVYAVAGTPNDILLRDPTGPAIATGAALVTVPTGVIAVAGDLPTFLKTNIVRITPPVGTMKFGRPFRADTSKITADSAAVTADRGTSGRAPFVIVGTIRTPAAGALSLTGFPPTVNATRSARPAAGSLVLAGLVATIVVSANINVLPNVGALSLTGQVPSVVVGTVRAPAAGSLVLTGNVATVVNGTNVAPATGALTITGYAPTVLQPINVTPAQGALALTGFVPTPNIGVNLSTATGALSLTGKVPTVAVTNNVSVAPAAGALSLTGFAATIVTPQVVLPNVGALSLTGFPPTPNIGVNVVTNTGALTLTGFAPTVSFTANVTVTTGVGPIVLTGFAPTIPGVPITVVAAIDTPWRRHVLQSRQLANPTQSLQYPVRRRT